MTKGQSKAKRRRRIKRGERARNAAADRAMPGKVACRNYGGGKADRYRNPEDREA